MSFTSFHFLVFFLVTLILGHAVRRRGRRVVLLVASYYFYASFNSWYLLLILFSSAVDYVAGRGIAARKGEDAGFPAILSERLWLIASILVNLGVLGFFKYTNFALDILHDTGARAAPIPHFDILLPAGISFYTFQSMSYTIDVYRGTLNARRNVIDFLLYVAFFPQLVAGPIVRATTFFPALDNPRAIRSRDMIVGMTRIWMGLFQKLVLSDNIAPIVTRVFAEHARLHPVDVWIGAVGWGFQIYFDFAGYSLMARGLARLFGHEYEINFFHPMAARNIREHWSRWHISLMTWFRDYVYIPMGGSRVSFWYTHWNTLLIWAAVGLWHGAGYNFVLSGIWQWVMLTVHALYSRTRLCAVLNKRGGRLYGVAARVMTIFFLVFGWIWFRAENLIQATNMQGRLFGMLELSEFSFARGAFAGNFPAPIFLPYAGLLALYFAYDYFFNRFPLDEFCLDENAGKLAVLCTLLAAAIVIFGNPNTPQFIYFVF